MKRSQAQRILDVLADGREHSHHEFYGWCVLHSRIAELRRRGHQIEVRRDGDLYLYRLVDATVTEPEPAVSRGGGVAVSSGERPVEQAGPDPGSVIVDVVALLEQHGFGEVIDGQLALEVA